MFSPPFIPPRSEGQRYSRRPAAPVTYEPTTATPEAPPRSAPPRITAPVFTRTPDTPRRKPEAEPPAERTAPAAPYLRQLPGALPPATRPLELTAGLPRDEDVLDLTEEAVVTPWEYEAMTAPGYSAPSIHDPEHDSWPVPAPPGDAIPAFGAAEDDVDDLELGLEDVIDELPGMGLDDSDVPLIEASSESRDDFPLDAFIVPRGVDHAPVGYVAEIGGVVADQLEDLARRIREQGIETIGHVSGADELSVVLGALVTGYLARHG